MRFQRRTEATVPTRAGRRMVLRTAAAAVCLASLASPSVAFVPSSLPRVRRRSVEAARQQTALDPRVRRCGAVPSSTGLFGKLWDRMQLEEDDECYWYVLNCMAGSELELLEQCRIRCGDMEGVNRFVVPTVKKTRSHGANKMVTETKVKYLGYVFANLRLCPETYEAIHELGLCRSWMGTVNQNGNKKLPPAPIALNYDEIEKFGLEDYQDDEEEEEEADHAVVTTNDGIEVILDTEEAEARELAEDKAHDDIVKKTYLGLRVDDMVKVTAEGMFLGEDGIVKRLKEGKILIRFFTYGTVYDHWMNPGDVRKMSDEEAMKGLGGPAQPITQRDFEVDQRTNSRNDYDMRNRVSRNSSGGNSRFNRQRRQDNNQRRFRSDMTGYEKKQNDENWAWYKDQQRGGERYQDGEWSFQGSQERRDGLDSNRHRYNNNHNNENSNSNSRFQNRNQDRRGPPSQRQQRRNNRQPYQVENRNAARALDGEDDWSSFVSYGNNPDSSKKVDSTDDFFESLMSDLSQDMQSEPNNRSRQKQRQQNGRNDGGQASAYDDSDFFASLASEISDDTTAIPTSTTSSDDDFFSSLSDSLSSDLDGGIDDKPSSYDEAAFSEAIEKDVEEFLSSDFGSVGGDVSGREHGKIDSSVGGNSPVNKPARRKAPTKQATPTPSDKAAATDYASMTVPALKEVLRSKGLKVSGKKAELIQRLQES